MHAATKNRNASRFAPDCIANAVKRIFPTINGPQDTTSDRGRLAMSNSSLPPVAPTLTYSFRRSIYVPERTYHLGLDSIDWQDEREKGSLAYADIRRVRVYDIPSSMFRTLRCVLQSRAGQTTVLDATHYLGFNSTEDRSASYLPFARELLAGIAAANTQTDFIMGHHWALWLFWLVIFIGSLFVLAGAVTVFFQGQMPWQAARVVGLVALFLPVGWRNLRDGRPRHFDPRVSAS
jgi:hypothetical protein